MIAALIVLGGCVASGGDGGILVLANVRATTGCTTTATATEPAISHGSLDLLLPSPYLFIAQMKSRIVAAAGQEDQRTIITSGAKIDIAFPGSTLFSDAELATLKSSGLTHLKQPFTVPLFPNGGISDAGFDLIPQGLVDQIAMKAGATRPFRLETVATFTVVGDMSGETVESQPFTYPITIGDGVTVNIAGTCDLPTTFGTPRPGYVCNPAQDGIVDCCTRSQTLVCPATVATM